MEILPAIDIHEGRVVRLLQGDYGQVTTYAESPVAAAARWAAEGAGWLHVVDLDGARAGAPAATAALEAIRGAVGIRIEAGGGLRTPAAVDRLLDAGIDRVVLGTAALADPALLDHVLARDPDALVVALDAREGRLATAGWLAPSGARVEDVARALAARGVRVFSHTDIARDGALGGPNLAAIAALQAALAPLGAAAPAILAGGGVASLADVRALRAAGVAGVILGRALYTGAIRLADALAVAGGAGGG